MNRLRRKRPFLESILKEANRFKHQELLEHANADQINAVSEMVLNLLKNWIPVKPRTLKRHKKVLREVGNHRNSLKRRHVSLLHETGNGFWQGLKECYEVCHWKCETRMDTHWKASMWFPSVPKSTSQQSELMKLLQEANWRDEKERENADYWRHAYHRLNQDYIALQFKDLCSECKRVKARADPSETYTLCETCHWGTETIRTPTWQLDEKEKENSYWQDCYEKALRQLTTDFPDGSLNNDERSNDDPHPRVWTLARL